MIITDHLYGWWDSSRYFIGSSLEPFYYFVDAPRSLIHSFGGLISSRQQLQEENDRLRNENIILRGFSQQMSGIQAENGRLRTLLNSSALLSGGVQITEVLSFSPDPIKRSILVDKGFESKVFVGQAVIDSNGLMGQVVEIYRNTARVLLLIDYSHAVPVLVNRNGVRAIASGIGSPAVLEIRHVAASTDIRVGDELVSSGLGGRFPPGYPVAIVTKVDRNQGQQFSHIEARPTASFDRVHHLLLVSNRGIDVEKDL